MKKVKELIMVFRGCQIGMQGSQLCAKPSHFCKLDMATSRMDFITLTYMFYKLLLQIQTIEGVLHYKIAPLTPTIIVERSFFQVKLRSKTSIAFTNSFRCLIFDLFFFTNADVVTIKDETSTKNL